MPPFFSIVVNERPITAGEAYNFSSRSGVGQIRMLRRTPSKSLIDGSAHVKPSWRRPSVPHISNQGPVVPAHETRLDITDANNGLTASPTFPVIVADRHHRERKSV